MQRPDEKKRQLIAKIAARLFATRPFHKVKLDDVAAQANVGKGTLYIYYKSKEDLYFSLIYDGFAVLVDQLERELATGTLSATGTLRLIVTQLVQFSFSHPHFFELIRTAPVVCNAPLWDKKRVALATLIENVIHRGNKSGEFHDAHPAITAACIPGLVRSVMLFGPKGVKESLVVKQIINLVECGVGVAAGTVRKTKKSTKGQLI